MAQQNPSAYITAIEIDESAFKQATENAIASIFNNRIEVLHQRIQAFDSKKLFDVIICNPPFFEKQLQSDNKKINIAKHSKELLLTELIEAIVKSLKDDGICSLLFPTNRENELQQNLPKSLCLEKIIYLHHQPNKASKRMIAFVKKCRQEETIRENFYLKDIDGNYTLPFVKAMKAFYLFL
jgi:tRNA1Val (adenine37-N6)-methyltransferase